MSNILLHNSLKFARKAYRVVNPESAFGRNWKMFPQKQYANELIYEGLMSTKPIMIARLGMVELSCLINFIGVHEKHFKSVKGFVSGQTPQWWWHSSTIRQMQTNAGFFPITIEKIEQFCKLMIGDMREVDILGSWLKEEAFFKDQLFQAKKIMLEDLEPFFSPNPWTRALKGKKVLVVHPFAETIKQQYFKHAQLFDNELLPEFELIIIKAVQSIAGEKTPFGDWFDALDWMKNEIEKADFDICILGCGAYGFPLAAHVKRMGKKAVHLGGVTQLLFGIKGKRWDEYVVYPYTNLYNEHWIRPGGNEKPKNAQIVEGACYW